MSEAAFYDSVTPALTAGDYQLIVQDTVTVDGNAQPSYASVQRFRVTGPRAGLGAHDVVAMSPPAGGQGSYDSWLPHVVLAQRSLPWQVAIDDQQPASGPAKPWLALLLLTGNEIDVAGAPPAAGSTGAQPVPLGRYLKPPAGTLGPSPTVGLTDLQLEQPGLSCTVVDVTLDAFRAVAPRSDELTNLAHVRYVDPADQETLQVPAPGWYSVVAGNRLPVDAPDDVYIAHLVSLEGFSAYLPDKPAPAGYSLVRLISLASWSFRSDPVAGDFAYLAERLGVLPLAVPISVTGTDAASRLVSGALAGGYTLLGYTTRLGEQTAAWYRGPCLPAQAAANPQPPFPAASAALIYDPATGMFDTSYAAAWEIGRLLTLANGPVSRSVAAWTGAAARAVRLLLERTRAGSAPAGTGTLAPGARQRAARRLIAGTVVPALLGQGGGRPAFGLPGDPAGLRDRALPGLLDTGTVRRIAAESADPYRQLREQAITAARAAAAAGMTSQPPGAVPAEAPRAEAPPAETPPAAADPAVPEGAAAVTDAVPRHEALRRLAADPAAQAQAAAAAGPVPADIASWLAGLRQLTGIPFSYLVPDTRMLPPESIRFFAVDPNWTDALVDGALSLAARTAPAAAAAAALRPAALAAAGGTAYSGFLLRSALVSGWPGMQVRGYPDPQATTTALPLARLERLAPTVLLALFTGTIARVELTGPPQHLHLGVIPAAVPGAAPDVQLRWIDAANAGKLAGATVPAVLRQDPARSVLDVNGTFGAVTQRLTQLYGSQAVLGPAAFSIQFLQATAMQPFSTAVTT